MNNNLSRDTKNNQNKSASLQATKKGIMFIQQQYMIPRGLSNKVLSSHITPCIKSKSSKLKKNNFKHHIQSVVNLAKNTNEIITKHRRITSKSKISEKVLTMNNFFRNNSKGSEKSKKQESVKKIIDTKNKKTQQNIRSNNGLHKKQHRKIKTDSDQVLDIFQHQAIKLNKIPSNMFEGLQISHQRSISHLFNPESQSKPKYALKRGLLSPQKIKQSKEVIQSSGNLRQSMKLKTDPKQWHFHDCLSLQKIELYTTNLKLSCQAWITLDYLEIKYLRGWNPKHKDDFTPLIKLFIVKTAYNLQQEGWLNLQKIDIRVSNRYLPQRIRQLPKHLIGIPNNTILSLSKLLRLMLITDFQDILLHAMINIGLIIYKIHTLEKQEIKSLENELNENNAHITITKTKVQLTQQIYLTDTNLLSHCYRQCQKYFTSVICAEFHLHQTSISICKKKYEVISTALDMAVLAMKCINYYQFRESINLSIYRPEVRYQVGWNFWENRQLQWNNTQLIKYGLLAIGGKNKRNNHCYVVWNQKSSLVTVMGDCKVNMHWRDNKRIEQWVQKHIARFSKKYYLNLSCYPTQTQNFWKIN